MDFFDYDISMITKKFLGYGSFSFPNGKNVAKNNPQINQKHAFFGFKLIPKC
jgi:hypothetical protein